MSEMAGFRFIFTYLARSLVVEKKKSLPSQTYQTTVSCGAPLARLIPITAVFGCASIAACFSVIIELFILPCCLPLQVGIRIHEINHTLKPVRAETGTEIAVGLSGCCGATGKRL